MPQSLFEFEKIVLLRLIKRLIMMDNRFNIRPAKPDEAGLVLEFIKKLAEYEKCAALFIDLL